LRLTSPRASPVCVIPSTSSRGLTTGSRVPSCHDLVKISTTCVVALAPRAEIGSLAHETLQVSLHIQASLSSQIFWIPWSCHGMTDVFATLGYNDVSHQQ